MATIYKFKKAVPAALLIVVLAALGYFLTKEPKGPSDATPVQEEGSTSAETPLAETELTLEQAVSCDYWSDKTFGRVNSGVTGPIAAGTLTLIGPLRKVSENVAVAFDESQRETVDFVYLVIVPPNAESQKTFYDYFMDLIAQGNGINKKDGQNLLFRLGIIENGKFVTTANVSDAVAKEIVARAERGEEASLNITIPHYPGSDAPKHFSFAC